MRKEEAEAVAQALLQPGRQTQQASQTQAHMRSEQIQSRGQRAWRTFAALGFLSGGAIGHFGYGNLTMGLIVGAAAGSVLGAVARAVVKRGPVP